MHLGYNGLWADVVSVFPAAVDDIACRAGQSPLHLKVGFPRSCAHTTTIVDAAINHIFRARTIKVPSADFAKNHWPLDLAALSKTPPPRTSRTPCLRAFARSTGRPSQGTPSSRHQCMLRTLQLVHSYIPFEGSNLTVLESVHHILHAPPLPVPVPRNFASCTRLSALKLDRGFTLVCAA
ncbi:hypothetical protein K488DRAFT_83287 [Vararia minispora EC-137]|uniref:Uncharacterized protein n=1 Tax=Vararia minispora EC-137 TaxID=1314806 RepID=A0ACB8QTP3_9AGAM|nr:hypothetical protein K488DRAFT_83287 [Vararia minispora EC-137]